MDLPIGYKVDELRKKKIKDCKKGLCPPKLVKKLRKAGIVSFSCRGNRLDWDVISADADALLRRLGSPGQSH